MASSAPRHLAHHVDARLAAFPLVPTFVVAAGALVLGAPVAAAATLWNAIGLRQVSLGVLAVLIGALAWLMGHQVFSTTLDLTDSGALAAVFLRLWHLLGGLLLAFLQVPHLRGHGILGGRELPALNTYMILFAVSMLLSTEVIVALLGVVA